MATTTPIMPKVISTSANVKAVFLKFPNLSTCVAPSANVNKFFPLSGENPRAPPPQGLSYIHAFYLLFNYITISIIPY